MSRLTTAQVISLGEYLEPDFDPASLTNPQLLGILGYHNINYPTPYTKPKLVQVFNDEIKAKAGKFKKERLKQENSLASDEGIIDGHSGQPLNGGSKVKHLFIQHLVLTDQNTRPRLQGGLPVASHVYRRKILPPFAQRLYAPISRFLSSTDTNTSRNVGVHLPSQRWVDHRVKRMLLNQLSLKKVNRRRMNYLSGRLAEAKRRYVFPRCHNDTKLIVSLLLDGSCWCPRSPRVTNGKYIYVNQVHCLNYV
jgi:hypothetical protein